MKLKIAALFFSLSVIVFAGQIFAEGAVVTLTNNDAESLEFTADCATTMTSGFISAHQTIDLAAGPCTVTIKKTGSSAQGSKSLTITNGKVN